MTWPVLYSFRRCPYAMRARLALLASETPCTLREVKLAAKPAAMLRASPKGTVPVLVLPDGRVMAESLEIMDWALARYDPLHWRPGTNTRPVTSQMRCTIGARRCISCTALKRRCIQPRFCTERDRA